MSWQLVFFIFYPSHPLSIWYTYCHRIWCWSISKLVCSKHCNVDVRKRRTSRRRHIKSVTTHPIDTWCSWNCFKATNTSIGRVQVGDDIGWYYAFNFPGYCERFLQENSVYDIVHEARLRAVPIILFFQPIILFRISPQMLLLFPRIAPLFSISPIKN